MDEIAHNADELIQQATNSAICPAKRPPVLDDRLTCLEEQVGIDNYELWNIFVSCVQTN